MRYKIGVIGLGRAGLNHIGGCMRVPNAEVVAICDTDANRLQEVAQKFDIKKTYTKAEKMSEEENLDITTIAVPPQFHKEYIEKILQYHQHILVEKPLATSLAEADECIRLTEGYDRKIMVNENFRWAPDFCVVTKCIEEGFIGEPYWIRVELMRMVTKDPTHTQWLFKLPHRWLLEDGVHWLDLFQVWLKVPARRVFTHFPQLPHMAGEKGDIFDIVHTIYEGGKGATLIQNFASKGFRPFEKEMETMVEIRVEGSEGAITVTWGQKVPRSIKNTSVVVYSQQYGGTFYPYLRDVGPSLDGSGYPYWDDTARAVMKHFLDCIEQDKQPMVSMKEERKALEVLFAAYDSAERGEVVNLPLK